MIKNVLEFILKSFKMFSENVKKQLHVLKIDSNKPVNKIRLLLEKELDKSKNLMKTSHQRYIEVQDAYSVFMEEYTSILDIKDALS